MKSINLVGAAIAGLVLAFGTAAPAQTTESTNDPSHIQDPRKEISPSAAQNDPDRGAKDPARIGTMTRSNQDLNNHRLPGPVTVTKTAPEVIYETSTPENTRYSDIPQAPREATPVTAAPPSIDTIATSPLPPVLPKTASRTPLVGLLGLASIAGALALRKRR